MPDRLPLALQTVYADLVDRCAADAFDANFPHGARFARRQVKDHHYWYFVANRAGPDGRRAQKYVGPDSPELQERIARHGQAKAAWRERRQMVNALRHSGLPSPDDRTGQTARGTGPRGRVSPTRLPRRYRRFSMLRWAPRREAARGRHPDGRSRLGAFHSVSVAISEDERALPLLEVLRGVDPSFREVPYAMDGRLTAAYAGEGGYRVEVLVPNRGSPLDEPQPLPAIGAMAIPLRFLDFLIYDAISAVLLHDGGVLVNVPRPERYALHKLIVSRRRREGVAKIDKDVAQAELLLGILAERRKADLRDAWEEARERGPKWRRLMDEALENVGAETRERLAAVVDRAPTG